MRSFSSNDGIGIVSDFAVSVDLDSDVTSLTPARAPRVTDDPVLLAARGAPTNNCHGVVCGAADTVEDTASVALEGLGSLKVDGNGAGCNGALGISNT